MSCVVARPYFSRSEIAMFQNRNKIRFCMISTFSPFSGGGLENVVKGILDCLDPEHFDIHVFFKKSKKQKEPINHTLTLNPCPHIPIPIVGDIIYNIVSAMRIDFDKFDIIHSHGPNGFGCTFFRKIFHKKTKVIWTAHGISLCSLDYYSKTFPFPKRMLLIILRKFISFLECYAARNCDIAVAISNGVKKEVTDYYRVNEEKIVVIHNGVNIERFRPLDKCKSQRKLGLSPNYKYVLFVGKEYQRKGLDLVIRIMKRLIDENIVRNLRLLVVGPESSTIREYFNEAFIIPIGKVNDNDLVYAYNASDFLIHPSRYEGGTPLAVLEALACGLPVIISKQSKPEIIKHGLEGLIVDNENIDGYIQNIKLLANVNLRAQISKNGRNLAENFSEKIQYGKYRELYLRIVEEKG